MIECIYVLYLYNDWLWSFLFDDNTFKSYIWKWSDHKVKREKEKISNNSSNEKEWIEEEEEESIETTHSHTNIKYVDSFSMFCCNYDHFIDLSIYLYLNGVVYMSSKKPLGFCHFFFSLAFDFSLQRFVSILINVCRKKNTNQQIVSRLLCNLKISRKSKNYHTPYA